MPVESRGFQMPADVAALHKLIAACWQTSGPAVTLHTGDLHWRLRPQPKRSPERDIQLWCDRNRFLAFAWFDPPDRGDLQWHPAANRESLEPELLTWLEGRARACGAPSLTVGAFQTDCWRERLLRARGYSQQSSFMPHLVRALTQPVAPASLPPGYSTGPTKREDLESLAGTIALAFESDPKPVSTYLALRADPFYRNDLDLSIRSEDGDIVAFCLAWLDEHNATGLLEPVGCHPDYRRRGLASAAIAAALTALYKAGARKACVRTNGENQAALALYTTLGFRTIARDYDWELAL